jgi:hypothetical protein
MVRVICFSTITAVALAFAGTAHAQDKITFTGTFSLTGTADVTSPGGTLATGTSFDALQGLPDGDYGYNKPTETIGDTTFNADTQGATDGVISFSNVGGGSDGGFNSSSAAYNSILSGCVYTYGTGVAGITIGNSGSTATSLIVGDEYEVQLFDAAGSDDNAVFTAGGTAAANSVELTGSDYALGTFVATAATESLSFTPSSPTNNAGVISAIAVRDLGAAPEPSTWALMLLGVGGLAFLSRRVQARI